MKTILDLSLRALAYTVLVLALVVWAMTWPIAWLNQAARRVVNPFG